MKVDFGRYDTLPIHNASSPDNRIIAVAHQLTQQGLPTVFISKDINARIKSDALGVRTMDFEAQKVDADRLYRGYVNAAVDHAFIDQLYEEKQLPMSVLSGVLKPNGNGNRPVPAIVDDDDDDEGHAPSVENLPTAKPLLYANQFVILQDKLEPSHTGLARRLGDTDRIIPVTGPRKPVFGIMGRNVQQTMALDLLLDDDIKLITMLGTAGSGKTLLALAAGMTKVLKEERYDRMLVARPIMPLGRDIGFLPGDINEKLSAWMQPIFDTLTYLLSTRGAIVTHTDNKSPEARIKALLDTGQIVLEPLTYIRGRSIPNQFMIVDEAQNLTPHEVKTIASRVGEGTKLILTGDVAQIDNPYLDSSSNGLSFVVEALKGQGIVAHVTLEKSERSDLASLVAERL